MSAPVFVVDPAILAGAQPGDVIVVDGPEGRHAVTVTRIRVGGAVDVVDTHGTRVIGAVQGIDGRDTMHVMVARLERAAPRQPHIVVVQALAKGDRGELAVEQLTEVGVDEIVPWSAAHCVVQWKADRLAKSHQRWADAAYAAAKQSRRSQFPVVAALADTAQVIARIARADAALVLHESASRSIAPLGAGHTGEVMIIVGPEGGLSLGELEAFSSAGATSVRLGPTVLRTSSAGMVAVAALLSGTTRWSVGLDGVEG